jgi:type II secretory pathway component GspD/PulD (secretin)
MNAKSVRCLVLGLLLVAANARSWAEEKKPLPAVSGGQLQKKLQRPVSFLGFDANTPVHEAFSHLAETQGLTILIDTQAFKDELQINDIETQPIRLPKLVNVPLRFILQQVAKQQQATVIVEGGVLWVVPAQRAKQRVLRQPVDLDFENVRLLAALNDVSEQTGFTIVVDSSRAADNAQFKLTTTLRGVALEDAVRTLADMAGLKAILVGDIFYVTTEPHAVDLAEEQKAREAERDAEREKKEQAKKQV